MEMILHDIRVNLLGVDGIPQVTVEAEDDHAFSIILSWHGSDDISEKFTISSARAKVIARNFKTNKPFDREEFDQLQAALAALEQQYNNKASR